MAGLPFPTREEIRSNQLVQLRSLLQGIIPRNRFYSSKIQSGGFELNDWNDLQHLPFTTKTELVEDQRAHPPYGTNLTLPLECYTRYHQTSGTTGTPLRWLDTAESWGRMVERWIEIFRTAEVDHHDRIVFAFSFGPFIGFWLAFDAASKLGALCQPAGGLSSLARLRLILDTQATVICCTPTYALRLAQVAAEEKVDLSASQVRRIMVAGEAGGSIAATRSRIEELWPGARVFDHHGMTEVGPVTFECPKRPGYLHVMESAYIAEVIDPTTGLPTDPGETGELVLTNLDRTGSPLLRYKTGDVVKATFGGPALASSEGGNGGTSRCGFDDLHKELQNVSCVCGRHEMLLEGGIMGRVDDMVIIRGVNVYPTAVEDVLRACGGIAEYQVKVNRSGALRELSVVVEPETDCKDVPGLVARIQKGFQNAFALRVPVEPVAQGTLPRFEMKAKRWVDQRIDPR